MSPHEWLSSGQWALAAAAAALIWIFSTGRMLGSLQTKFEGRMDAIDEHLEGVDGRVVAMEGRQTKTDQAVALVSGRMDQAGDLMSDLASKVQAMPTQEAMTAVWRELSRLQEELRDSAKHRANLAERIASIEGEQHGRRS
jgi:predicted  nucleic acid-binding Zn-ribbon protein